MQSSSRGSARVRLLAVHTTEGIMRAAALRDWKSWPGSSHAACDETGALLSGAADGFVDYGKAAWTLRSGNAVSENIEQCGWARWTRAEWLERPKLLEATARWLAARSKARGIPLVKLTPAEVKAGRAGVIGHVDWTVGMSDGTHTDPGKGYPWDVVLARANAIAGGKSVVGAPTGKDIDMATGDEILQVLRGYGARIEDIQAKTIGFGGRTEDIQARVTVIGDRQVGYGRRTELDQAQGIANGALLQQLVARETGQHIDTGKLATDVVDGVTTRVLALVGQAVRDELGADNEAQADAIVDRLAARLAGAPV